jgi:hypothetical protein
MPMNRITDKASEAKARTFIETLLPDPTVREQCLSALVDSIERADEAESYCWNVAQHEGRRLQLNAGNHAMLWLYSDRAEFCVDGNDKSGELQELFNRFRSTTAKYKTLPQAFFITDPILENHEIGRASAKQAQMDAWHIRGALE